MSSGNTRALYHFLAFLSGGLLAVMLLLNGTLAAHTSATFSSWVAHGTGAALALGLLLMRPRGLVWRGGAPLWAYLGGLSGAVTVIVTAVAMNSALALSGTLALGLAGQAAFGLLADRLGLFGLAVRRPGWRAYGALALILVGSGLVILGGAG
jgi:bacterial/archaeal transporter family-2 protein